MTNIPNGEPLMMPWSETYNPHMARIEMKSWNGSVVAMPDYIMPQFETEPITMEDLYGPDWRIKEANTSKLRSIIRSGKLHDTYRSIIRKCKN